MRTRLLTAAAALFLGCVAADEPEPSPSIGFDFRNRLVAVNDDWFDLREACDLPPWGEAWPISGEVSPQDSSSFSIWLLGVEIWSSNPKPGHTVVFSIEDEPLASFDTATGELTCATPLESPSA